MFRLFSTMSQISTHTSRVGCDFVVCFLANNLCISTHTSRVGCDQNLCFVSLILPYFYSHIPCGMWPCTPLLCILDTHFYSHIPCGMWPTFYFFCYVFKKFLLTHPVWDVTIILSSFFSVCVISTHTSRVGCDQISCCEHKWYANFYSHIPCGMWPDSWSWNCRCIKFLLTHPVWDVTLIPPICLCKNQKFLLTHPVWDVTSLFSTYLYIVQNFYSHIPCGMWR